MSRTKKIYNANVTIKENHGSRIRTDITLCNEVSIFVRNFHLEAWMGPNRLPLLHPLVGLMLLAPFWSKSIQLLRRWLSSKIAHCLHIIHHSVHKRFEERKEEAFIHYTDYNRKKES